MTPDGVLEVASLRDLLAHKLKVILQRVDVKDYTDIDAILSSGLSLADGLAGAQALYREFAPQEALKAMAYFKDGNLDLLPDSAKKRLVAAANSVRRTPVVRVIGSRLGTVRSA